jgi:aminoglycoside 3-N-acetyltransferase
VTREAELIAATDAPRTVDSLTADLRALGLGDGDVVLVHSSLAALGWVNGGAQAACEALLAAVAPSGTIVVPTQSGGLSDPADWVNPPVPAEWVETIRATMPGYDAERTPTRGMGAIPELMRTWPGARRSAHPHVSFAAVGPSAETIVGEHPLDDALGDQSPLARLYELDAWVLLLGVGHVSNTSLHLAEYRSGVRPRVRTTAPVASAAGTTWREWDDIDLDASVFEAIGAAFGDRAVKGTVGSAEARLMRQRGLVDFGVEWLRSR